MSLQLPFGIKPVNAVANVDERYGPHLTIADALIATAGTRVKGLTVGVLENGAVAEYWFKDGILDTDLKVKTTNSGEITVYDPLKENDPVSGFAYEAGNIFVSYISPDAEMYPETDPLSENYVYRCIEGVYKGESPEVRPTKWLIQGKVSEVNGTTGTISDILGLQEALDSKVDFVDFSDEFKVQSNTVSLNVKYITINSYTGGENIQPEIPVVKSYMLSSTGEYIQEGSNKNITIVLTAQPTNTVSFSITSSDLNKLTVTNSIEFNTVNWNIPQIITLTSLEDIDLLEDTITVTISKPTSLDTEYNNLTSTEISIIIVDNDVADYIISPAVTSVNEGYSIEISIYLSSSTTGEVVFNVTSSDITIATINKQTLTFNTTNWSIPQIVTVTTIEDLTSYIDKSVTINFSLNSTTDSNFSGLIQKTTNITVINTTEEFPSEVKIGGVIWKTSNEMWTDGGEGIYHANGSSDNDINYGLLYTGTAINRLLAANPGYRLPTTLDLANLEAAVEEELTGIYPSNTSGWIEPAGPILSDNSTLWIDNYIFSNTLKLSFVPAGYTLTGDYFTYFAKRGYYAYYNDLNFIDYYIINGQYGGQLDVYDSLVQINRAMSVRLVKDI